MFKFLEFTSTEDAIVVHLIFVMFFVLGFFWGEGVWLILVF